MALKGSAIIELTNADGSRETIKQDNMITNAPRDLMTARRGEMPPLFQIVSNGDSYAQALFGGILLFNETLNDDPDDYYLPSVNVTGYASQDAYAGLDIARGSFNASEGGVQEDGSYKFVWDFATSQANGQIKSIALCPNMMGQIGASNTIQSGERKAFNITNAPTAPFNTSTRTLKDSESNNGVSNYYFHAVAVVNGIVYAIDECNLKYDKNYASRFILQNGGILRLHKFSVGIEGVSVCDNICMARYLGYDDVQLPSAFTGTLYSGSDSWALAWSYNNSTGVLSIFPCSLKSSVNVNTSFPYVEVALKGNYAVTTRTFTNTTAGIIQADKSRIYRSELGYYNFYVGNKYIVAVAYISADDKNKFYVINKDDNTDVKEVKWQNGNLFSTSTAYIYSPAFELGDNMVVFRALNSYTNTSPNNYILDLRTARLIKTNITTLSDTFNIDIGAKAAFIRTDTYLGIETLVNPFVLTTKNNLDTPVTKTASQTMKITYTLSEVAEV